MGVQPSYLAERHRMISRVKTCIFKWIFLWFLKRLLDRVPRVGWGWMGEDAWQMSLHILFYEVLKFATLNNKQLFVNRDRTGFLLIRIEIKTHQQKTPKFCFFFLSLEFVDKKYYIILGQNKWHNQVRNCWDHWQKFKLSPIDVVGRGITSTAEKSTKAMTSL